MRKINTPRITIIAEIPVANIYFKSTIAPTNTNKITTAATHSLENFSDNLVATTIFLLCNAIPILMITRSPRIGTTLSASNHANRKDRLSKMITFEESLICTLPNSIFKVRPIVPPTTTPTKIKTGISNILKADMYSPLYKVKSRQFLRNAEVISLKSVLGYSHGRTSFPLIIIIINMSYLLFLSTSVKQAMFAIDSVEETQ